MCFQEKASVCVMGFGQLLQKQWIKGLLYFSCFIAFVFYLITIGIQDIIGFFTLGTQKSDSWLGIKGDDSIIMMLRGLLAFLIITVFVFLHISNIKDAKLTQKKLQNGEMIPSFFTACNIFFDKKFYIIALAIPLIGILIFNILPIIFMILIAFTNYGGNIVPPELVDWIGLKNFQKILSLTEIKNTFFKILSWNFTWAILSTAINYFGGLGIALLLNKKCVKHKTFWRSFPILAYAVPGFITLLGFKFMFSYGGPINYYISLYGGNPVGFLDIDAGIKAKLIGLLINAWMSIPTSMLLATGILSNMNKDVYDAADIDGASKMTQFIKITLPFVIFSTTPTLITSFVGNFNNFGIFYFLRGGLYTEGLFLASDTDLLINWLYNLSIDNNYYGIGAAISFLIFLITSGISLLTYVKSNAYKKEDTYQ